MMMMMITRERLLTHLSNQLPETISWQTLQEGGWDIPLVDSTETPGMCLRLQAVSLSPPARPMQQSQRQLSSVSSFSQGEEEEEEDDDETTSSTGSITTPVSQDLSQKSVLYYRQMFHHMPVAAVLHRPVWHSDESGSNNDVTTPTEPADMVDSIFQDVNPAFCRTFNLTRDEIIGRRCFSQVFPGVQDDVPANWKHHFARVALHGGTHEFHTYSQELGRWYAGVVYRPDPNSHEFCCIFMDISQDMSHQDELTESEERHRNLFESMVQGVVYHNVDGHIIEANPAAERILGLTVDQMKGRQSIDPRWKAVKADGSDFPGDQHPAMEALRTGQPQMDVTMGVYHPVKDEHRWIKVDAIPRFHKHDDNMTATRQPFQVYATFTDVTSERRFAEEILKARAKAEHADRLKSAFLANMSHEIRTPLNGIMGYVDLALSNRLSADSRADNLEGLRIARNSGELLLSIIQDILDLSKIEAGQMEVKCDESFSLRELVDQTSSLARTLIASKGKDIEFVSTIDTAEVLDSICGDHFRLQQIVNNLISNAVKFTDSGRVTLDAQLCTCGCDSYMVEFRVRDTGKGIPASHRESIFEPFRQVEIGDTRQHGGTGLGLTISRKLAQMMGGDLQVESSTDGPEKGSCFTITIPYVPGKALTTRKASDSNHVQDPPLAPPTTESNKKILVSEDDVVSRRMIDRMLTASGYDVLLAANGQEAVSMYEKHRREIGLVLMDVQMPVMDGYLATERIRETERRFLGDTSSSARIPIIALSASAMKGDHEKGLSHGMSDYLTKPVNRKLLLETLEGTLGVPAKRQRKSFLGPNKD